MAGEGTIARMKRYALVGLVLGAPAGAQAVSNFPLELERLPDGSTLIADGGSIDGSTPGIVTLVAGDGTLLHVWSTPMNFTHSAELLSGGRVLVTDSNNDRVIEMARDGTVVWDSDDVTPLSDGSALAYPNDADPLPNGNVLLSDRDNHRVLELDHAGNVVWQFGVTGVAGGSATLINGPHNPDWLANGRVLFADSGNNRVLEVDPATNAIVWEFQPLGPVTLLWPRDADRMPDGSTVIADSLNNRLVIADPGGAVTGLIPTFFPYDVDALPGGTFLVGGGGPAVEIDGLGNTVWQYPPFSTSALDVPVVVNPTSGVPLHVHVHVPPGAGPSNRRPAVVYVPDLSDDGAPFEVDCTSFADLGFVAVHFDPDGRGQSTAGGTYTGEDYGGFVQQDGLREVLLHVAGRADVDAGRIAVYSRGYGVTMASGALARYPDAPPVAMLVDWEGPASRAETAQELGGHVPVPASDDAFWSEREAIAFLPSVRARYARIQTAVDHDPPHTGNFHAIDLANAALSTVFGGGGVSPDCRVNAELENPANRPWSLGAPPAWIPESIDVDDPHLEHRLHLLLQRGLFQPKLDLAGPAAVGGAAVFQLDAGAKAAGSFAVVGVAGGPGPTPFLFGGWLNLDVDGILLATLTATVLDGTGAGSVVYPIPPTPSLAGTQLFAQAFALTSEPQPYVAAPPVAFTIQ